MAVKHTRLTHDAIAPGDQTPAVAGRLGNRILRKAGVE